MSEYTVFGFHERDGVSFACDVIAEDKHDAISQARRWATTLRDIGRGNIIVATVSERPNGDDGDDDGPIDPRRDEDNQAALDAVAQPTMAERAEAMMHERGQLEEMGWAHEAVSRMTDTQVNVAYEAEVDRAHEESSDEARYWTHDIQPMAEVLHEVRELASGIPNDAEYALLLGRLAVIKGKIPPAVWSLIE